MKKALSISVAAISSLIIFFMLFNCEPEEHQFGGVYADISSDTVCINVTNWIGEEVYLYRADDFFGKPSIQAGGGHLSGDDLGINIFEDFINDFQPGNYTITSGDNLSGTGYIYYKPDGDNPAKQYVSIGSGKIVVEKVVLEEDFMGTLQVVEFAANVSSVRMYNPTDHHVICISDLRVDVDS